MVPRLKPSPPVTGCGTPRTPHAPHTERHTTGDPRSSPGQCWTPRTGSPAAAPPDVNAPARWGRTLGEGWGEGRGAAAGRRGRGPSRAIDVVAAEWPAEVFLLFLSTCRFSLSSWSDNSDNHFLETSVLRLGGGGCQSPSLFSPLQPENHKQP